MTTYKITRFHQDDDAQVIRTGLTLAEAQEHCRREDTHGEGWFDGYEVDSEITLEPFSSKAFLEILYPDPEDQR